jgi:glycosyltransferase involved in cell wall biosynthesis
MTSSSKTKKKKLISIVTPCLNEEGNVMEVYQRVKNAFSELKDYNYEHIFMDNYSTDNTLKILKGIAKKDKRVKIIVNSRNFGPIKSVFNGVLAASGDAAILLVADLQDPPELIPRFIEEWKKGYKAVFGIRKTRQETWLVELTRKIYYRALNVISYEKLHLDAGDFVLIDGVILKELHHVSDRNPYLRGVIASFGYEQTGIEYDMQKRVSGKTTTTISSLINYALTGVISFTTAPLRLAMISGFILSFLSILIGLIQLILKLISPAKALPGIATLIVGLFLFSGIQFFLIGFLGEYISAIHSQIRGGPLVVEKERINFDQEDGKS